MDSGNPLSGTESVSNHSSDGLLETLLRRDRIWVLAGIVWATVLAWIYMATLSHEQHGMAGAAGGAHAHHGPASISFLLLFVMWIVMVVAMMLPTASPMRLTTLLEGMGRGDEALQALNRYNQKKPTDPTPLLAILRISNRYNNEQSFNYAMERLSKIPRQQGAITTELARIRAEGGGPIMGAAMFERSGLDFTLPANSLALDQWVTYLIELKRLRKALNLARTSATAVPQFPSFQEIKGKALIASGAHEQGVKALKKALSLSPERASTLALLAQEQVRLGQAAEAIALYDRATLSEPDEPDYPWRAILLALDEGQTENAQSRLETLTKRHGEFAKANQQLALMILNEEPDRSLELATRAVRFRGGPDALTTLGQVQVQRGEYQKALKALRRSLNTRPNSPSTSYWMAMAHSGMGDSAAARKELSQALESPSFPEQEAAKKQWAQLEASP